MLSVTFGDQVQKMENILNKLRDFSSKDNDIYEGENFHPFGPHNLYMEQSNINEIISSMKTKYKRFHAINNPAMVMKLVSEKQVLCNITEPMKSRLVSSINKIRDSTKGASLRTAVLKLEAISKAENLRFDSELSKNCFISSDMFYMEISFDGNGVAEDVKLHGHTGEPKSCKELTRILRKKDYNEFQVHLNSLRNRYDLLGNAVIKSKILTALEIIEGDVLKIMKNESLHSSTTDYISKGALGYVLPRTGGKPMQLVYCHDPLSVLHDEREDLTGAFSEEDQYREIARYSAELIAKTSNLTTLPTSSTFSPKNVGLDFGMENPSNYEELPATFVLQFPKQLAMSLELLKSISNCLERTRNVSKSAKAPLGKLVLRQFLGKSLVEEDNKEFTVILQDFEFITRYNAENDEDNLGVLVANIPFTRLGQLARLIKILRCQAQINILLCSCFKTNSSGRKTDCLKKNLFALDVCLLAWNVITASFIHPIDQTISSIDFQVLPTGSVECSLNVLADSPVICTNLYLSHVANRSLSIPVTLRCFYKKAKSYKPELHKSLKLQLKEKSSQRSLTLSMPSISQIQNNIISPHITGSPSTFLNFSASGISPGTPMFPFDSTTKVLPIRKGTNSAATSSAGTPNSDGSKTPNKSNLKIKLKRKRNENSEIYEIDQTKSELDIISTNEDINNQITMSMPDSGNESLSFVYSQFEGNLQKPSIINTNNQLFSENVSFNDLTLEGETDISKLLGIPSEPFIQGTSQVTSQIQGFDLDALTSGDFDTANPSVIDPTLMTTQTSFDMDSSTAIDIDSLMNIH